MLAVIKQKRAGKRTYSTVARGNSRKKTGGRRPDRGGDLLAGMPGGALVAPPGGRVRLAADREIAGTLFARKGRAQAPKTRSWPDGAGRGAGAAGRGRGASFTRDCQIETSRRTGEGSRDYLLVAEARVLVTPLGAAAAGPAAAGAEGPAFFVVLGAGARDLPEVGRGVRTRPVVGGPAAGVEAEAPAPPERGRPARPGNMSSDIF